MPPRDWRLRVEDILDAIAKIQRYAGGMTFEAFCVDQKTVDAVLRNIEIVGEAARYLPAEVEARHPRIPWGKLRAMRNVVIHGYADVSLTIVWDTIRQDLPPLVPALRQVLALEA